MAKYTVIFMIHLHIKLITMVPISLTTKQQLIFYDRNIYDFRSQTYKISVMLSCFVDIATIKSVMGSYNHCECYYKIYSEKVCLRIITINSN